MRHYCTYLDFNRLTQGLALHLSLAAQAGPFELVVLCLDQDVAKALSKMAPATSGGCRSPS